MFVPLRKVTRNNRSVNLATKKTCIKCSSIKSDNLISVSIIISVIHSCYSSFFILKDLRFTGYSR